MKYLLTVKNNVLTTALCLIFGKNIHQHVDLLSLVECNLIQYLRSFLSRNKKISK